VSFDLTLVVPTRDEAPNVAELLARLGRAVGGPGTEILVVDDSEDDTAERVRALAPTAGGSTVRCRHRAANERIGGLGGAVLDGLRAAQAPWVCVMDGDLQHRPELVPALARRAAVGDVDLVVASRYATEGSPTGLGRTRDVTARLGRAVAHASLPGALGRVTDPLSGFFLVRRAALDLDALAPNGFKVLVEILARTPDLRVAEIAHALDPRAAGRSKAGPREAVRLLGLLRAARRGAAPPAAPHHPLHPSHPNHPNHPSHPSHRSRRSRRDAQEQPEERCA
jgi:dolichol-phosphate mannosyltransferase